MEYAPSVIEVRTEEDLRLLASRKWSIWPRAEKPQIVLNLPTLNHTSQFYYESELARLLTECGCSRGAVSGLIGIVIYAAFVMLSAVQIGWTLLPLGGIVTLTFAAAGKMTAIALARRSVRRKLKKIIAALDNSGSTSNME